jgi:hypothetical protein
MSLRFVHCGARRRGGVNQPRSGGGQRMERRGRRSTWRRVGRQTGRRRSPHRRCPWPGWAVGIIGWAAVACPLRAQQNAAAGYHALQLDCGRFQRQARAEVTLEAGRQRSKETTGHEGVMIVRATGSDSLIHLEAWFDSLHVWREGSGQRMDPDTDGLIGGRYRGVLSPTGGFRSTDTPFIPDEVAQVADLSGELADLLPPVPPIPLDPGRSWRDDLGTVITRLPDETLEARRTERFRLVRRFTGTEHRMLPDSTEVTATRTETETGTIDWLTELGPVRWERDITDQIDVPTGGTVRQPFRSRIEQHILTTRLGGSCEPD